MEKDKKHEVIFEKHNIPDARHIKFVAPEHHQSSTSSGMSSFPLIGLLLGVVIAGSVLGLYFMEMNKQSTSYQNQNQTILPTQYPQVTSNPVYTQVSQNQAIDTSNWKTYLSEKYGYSVMYPNDWSQEYGCEGGENNDYVCFKSADFEEGPAGAVMGLTLQGGLIQIDGNTKNISPLFNQFKMTIDEFCNPEDAPLQPKVSECREIEGDKHLVIVRIHDATYSDAGVMKNGKFTLWIRATYNKNSREEVLTVLNSMVKTFKL